MYVRYHQFRFLPTLQDEIYAIFSTANKNETAMDFNKKNDMAIYILKSGEIISICWYRENRWNHFQLIWSQSSSMRLS